MLRLTFLLLLACTAEATPITIVSTSPPPSTGTTGTASNNNLSFGNLSNSFALTNGQIVPFNIEKIGNQLRWTINGSTVSTVVGSANTLYLGLNSQTAAALFNLNLSQFSLPNVLSVGSLSTLQITDNLLLGDWKLNGSFGAIWTGSPNYIFSLNYATPVSEAATFILVGLGILGIALRLRKARKKKFRFKLSSFLPKLKGQATQ